MISRALRVKVIRSVCSALVFNNSFLDSSEMASPNSAIAQKLNTLKKSKFRSKFKLISKDLDYISSKGLETIKGHAYKFINERIAPDFPKNDGKQTPIRGILYLLQSMRPPPAAGVVCGNGTGLKKNDS